MAQEPWQLVTLELAEWLPSWGPLRHGKETERYSMCIPTKQGTRLPAPRKIESISFPRKCWGNGLLYSHEIVHMLSEIDTKFSYQHPPFPVKFFFLCFWLVTVWWNWPILVIWYIITGLCEILSLHEQEKENPFCLWVLPCYLEKRMIICFRFIIGKINCPPRFVAAE